MKTPTAMALHLLGLLAAGTAIFTSAHGVAILGSEYKVAAISSECSTVQTSGGDVSASLQVLTRSVGVSPETIYFSAQQSDDPDCVDFSGGSDIEACRTGQYFGYHFDFDDPDSGAFSTTGNSKNRQVGGAPRAAHTFVCDGEENSRWNASSQQCEYAVKVRVQNPDGDWADACVDVSVRPQSVEYTPEETYCISSDSDFSLCPTGVPSENLLTDTPAPDVSQDLSHTRILYQRGSSGTYSPLCIGYDEHNIRVDAYGEGSDPVVELLAMGRALGCNDAIPNAAQIAGYDPLSKDVNGHVISGWNYGNSVANLRLGEVVVGMTTTLLTLHNLDLDWSAGGASSGAVRLISSGPNCHNNADIDCAQVHHPYGMFVSDVRSHGNVGALPPWNISCVADCGMINSAILGAYGKVASGHNLRVMGAWGLIVSNSHFAGDHIGGNGPKSKITLRQLVTDVESSEVTDPEDFENGNHGGDGPGWQRTAELTHHFSPRYNFLIDNVIGDTTQNALSEEAGWVELHPGHQYSGVFGSRFEFWGDSDLNSSQIVLGGRNLTTHNTSFNGENVTCRIRARVFPQPSFYFDEDLVFSDAPDGACNGQTRALPVPDAPGPTTERLFADGFE